MNVWINSNGYEVFKKRTRKGRTIFYHTVVAESFFRGSLPTSNVIHHIDENRKNNEPWNLMVCSRKQHSVIHQKLRAEKACGNQDWQKCYYCQKYDALENLFIGVNKRAAYHLVCANKNVRERYKSDPEYRKKVLRHNRKARKRQKEANG